MLDGKLIDGVSDFLVISLDVFGLNFFVLWGGETFLLHLLGKVLLKDGLVPSGFLFLRVYIVDALIILDVPEDHVFFLLS